MFYEFAKAKLRVYEQAMDVNAESWREHMERLVGDTGVYANSEEVEHDIRRLLHRLSPEKGSSILAEYGLESEAQLTTVASHQELVNIWKTLTNVLK